MRGQRKALQPHLCEARPTSTLFPHCCEISLAHLLLYRTASFTAYKTLLPTGTANAYFESKTLNTLQKPDSILASLHVSNTSALIRKILPRDSKIRCSWHNSIITQNNCGLWAIGFDGSRLCTWSGKWGNLVLIHRWRLCGHERARDC